MKHSLIAFLSILGFMYCQGQSNDLNIKFDTIQINLNERLLFKVGVDSSDHLTFSKVNGFIDSTTIMSIELTYNGAAGTILKLNNPFSKEIVYKAELYSHKKKKFLETSTVPIFPGISSYETWPYKIDTIQLSGFKLQDP